MAKRVKALANPELLRWARETAGYAVFEAAKKAGVKPARIEQWEAGDDQPTITQLRNLSHIYKRPIALFYLPEPPETPEPPKDFRRLPGTVANLESPELRFEIRRAHFRREIALELMSLEGEEPSDEVVDTAEVSDGPANVGSRIREKLGVELTTQFGWSGAYDAFNGWRAAVERAGVLVLQMTDVEMSEARGFSISETPLPVVVANTKDSPRGRVFTLMHEVAHLMLRDGGLCDLNDVDDRPPELLRIEQFCNSAAGAALVPEDVLVKTSAVRQHGDADQWSDQELAGLANAFSVSREVVLRRLLDLGKTSGDFYAQKREEFLEAYEAARHERGEGFAPPHQLALASTGPSFAGLVLASYSDGLITASDLSDYLGIRLKHLPRIQEQLVGLKTR